MRKQVIAALLAGAALLSLRSATASESFWVTDTFNHPGATVGAFDYYSDTSGHVVHVLCWIDDKEVQDTYTRVTAETTSIRIKYQPKAWDTYDGFDCLAELGTGTHKAFDRFDSAWFHVDRL